MDEVMTTQEVAKYLKISDAMVVRLARSGDLPAKRIGGLWRYNRSNIEDYVQGDSAMKARLFDICKVTD
jgi:excisionase family DNA binding protein